MSELLEIVEYCLANGFEQPTLLRTSGQLNFQSSLSETYLARHFLENGFGVRGFDDTKGNDPVPDLLVTSGNNSLVCEVYAPRDWPGLGLFEEDLRLGLKHLDEPFDYDSFVTMRLIKQFGDDRELLHFDPWRFSEATGVKQSRSRVAAILKSLASALRESHQDTWTGEFPEKDLNVMTRVQVSAIRSASGNAPMREASGNGITLTGYAPEGMFRQLMTGGIANKLRRRQASFGPNADIKMLYVEVGNLTYPECFEHSYYGARFDEAVHDSVDWDRVEYDAITFVRVGAPSTGGTRVLKQYFRPQLDHAVLSHFSP